MNTQKISPQGYNLQRDPLNENPFWEQSEGGGGNVPAGGTAGQVLTKRTAADYDTEWKTPESGGGVDWPEGGADGDLLVKSGNSAEWETPDFPSTADLAAVEATAEAAATTAQEAKAGLTSETAARTAADTALGDRIGAVETDLAGYKTATDADIADLETGLSAETAARTAADTALGTRIDGVGSDLAHYETATDAELQTLNTEDARLEGLITAETEARIDADSLIREDLGADISAETTARTAADNELRSLIADNTGDIEAQQGAISGINTRLTTAEGDIDALETRIGTAETGITALDGRVTAAETEITAIPRLPGYHSSNAPFTHNAKFAPIDGPVSSAGTRNISLYLHGKLADDGETLNYSWEPGTVPRFNNGSNGGALPVVAIFSRTSSNDFGYAFGLIATNSNRPNAKGQMLVYSGNIGNGSSQSNADVTDPISGGTTGQVLTKTSNANYDWEWKTPESGGSGGGLPSGGSAGDLLAKTATGAEWTTPNYATTTQLAAKADADTVTAIGNRLTTAESDIDTLEAFIPSGGSTGDLLAKTSSGTQWKTPNYATTAQLATKADADTVTGLGTRLKTAEGDIDTLENRATRDEQNIEAAAALGTKALTVGKFVNLTMGALTAPDFVGLPWVWYDAGGIMHGFKVSDTDAKNAPDGWAQYYNGGGGSYVGTPVYFDTPLKTATTVLNNTTYGGSAGKLYFPTTGDMPTAISRPFSISGGADECYTVQVDINLTSPDMTGYVFHGGVVTTLRRSTGVGYTAIVGGHFDITAGNTSYYHAGGPDDFKIAIENRGNGNFTAYLGVNNSFINYLRSIVSTPYRFHVNDFRVSKLLGVLA